MNIEKENIELYKLIVKTIKAVKDTNTLQRLISDCSDKLNIDIELIEDTLKYNNYKHKGN